MKKLLFLFLLSNLFISAAFSQNDTYTGDEATVTVKATQAPPPLFVYAQPACPAEGYAWQPGYWGWNGSNFFWVPGVWVRIKDPNLVWTPGYWSFYGTYYGWHTGYWSDHVGYYGGLHYGCGYPGLGFTGGKWMDNAFQYNSKEWNVDPLIVHHTYQGISAPRKPDENLASFNGTGGIIYQPMANEEMFMKEKHFGPTIEQLAHQEAALRDKSQLSTAKAGKPAYYSMNKPGGQGFDEKGNVPNEKSGKSVKK